MAFVAHAAGGYRKRSSGEPVDEVRVTELFDPPA
jgi:hypothetical protein